jgi:2-iminobutanoate/2-iminopropanoate deaminase
MTKIERFMVPGQREPVSHFCHATRAGPHIWVSGMVGVNDDGSIPEDTVEQFKLAMASMDASLRHAGGKPEHIVKVQVFLSDMADRGRINPIRQEYFGVNKPSSTLLEVSAFVDPRMKCEIEVQAYVEDE